MMGHFEFRSYFESSRIFRWLFQTFLVTSRHVFFNFPLLPSLIRFLCYVPHKWWCGVYCTRHCDVFGIESFLKIYILPFLFLDSSPLASSLQHAHLPFFSFVGKSYISFSYNVSSIEFFIKRFLVCKLLLCEKRPDKMSKLMLFTFWKFIKYWQCA